MSTKLGHFGLAAYFWFAFGQACVFFCFSFFGGFWFFLCCFGSSVIIFVSFIWCHSYVTVIRLIMVCSVWLLILCYRAKLIRMIWYGYWPPGKNSIPRPSFSFGEWGHWVAYFCYGCILINLLFFFFILIC